MTQRQQCECQQKKTKYFEDGATPAVSRCPRFRRGTHLGKLSLVCLVCLLRNPSQKKPHFRTFTFLQLSGFWKLTQKQNTLGPTDKEILIWPSKHSNWVFGAFINDINISYLVIVMLSPASWHYVINNHLKQNRCPRKSHFSNNQGKHIKYLLKPPFVEWKNIFLLAPLKKVASFGTSVVIFLPAVGRSRVSVRHLQGPTIHM